MNEFDLSDSLCGTKEPRFLVEESLADLVPEAAPLDDPLDWLIDGGICHLPESSLDQAPIFQNCLDSSSQHYVLDAENEEVVLYPDLQEIADPKVTVQSLFLEDGDDHLP